MQLQAANNPKEIPIHPPRLPPSLSLILPDTCLVYAKKNYRQTSIFSERNARLLSYTPGQFKNTFVMRKRSSFLLPGQPGDTINPCGQAGPSGPPRTGGVRPSPPPPPPVFPPHLPPVPPAPPAGGAPGAERAAANHRSRNRFPDLSLAGAGRGCAAGGGAAAGSLCAPPRPAVPAAGGHGRAGCLRLCRGARAPRAPVPGGRGVSGKTKTAANTYSRTTSGRAFFDPCPCPSPANRTNFKVIGVKFINA